MQLVARSLRLLTRFLADPNRSGQDIARANAAQATTILREQRHERDEVDAYVQAKLSEDG